MVTIKMAVVTSVNISKKKGTVKKQINEITLKKEMGIIGDAHNGNWHRQISLLAEESVKKVKVKIPGITHGAFAENINTEGICLYELPLGTLLKIGTAVIEVTQIGKECHNSGCAIKRVTGDCVMPREGIFAVVREEGSIKAGDEIKIL